MNYPIQTRAKLSGLGSSNAQLWFSPKGNYVGASTYGGGSNQIWRVDSGKPVFAEPIAALVTTVSPDELRVAMSMLSGSVVVYELNTGHELGQLATDEAPAALAFHPDGRRVAIGLSQPTSVLIWDVDTNSVVSELRDIKSTIHAIAWQADGRQLVLSLAAGATAAEIWDTVERESVTGLEGHAEDVLLSYFLQSERLLATGSWDGTIRVWDARTARQLVVWPSNIVVAADTSGAFIGHVWNQSQFQFVELVAGDEYRTLVSSLGPGKGEYRDGGLSPDGRLLAVGMGDGVRLWDLPTAREIAYLPIETTLSPTFSPDGKELITSGASGLLRWPIKVDGSVDESESASGKQPPIAKESRAIQVGPPRTVLLSVVPYYANRTPDARTLAFCSTRADEILLMNLATEKVETEIKTNTHTDRVVLSANGRWAASSGWHSTKVQVWDARIAALVKELPLGTLTFVAFSPDSKHLITSRAGEFCFWEIESWRKVKTIPRENCPYPGTVAFSPDGRSMALELVSATISILDVETGRTLCKLEDPHRDRPDWMSFTPDGNQFVVISRYARNIHVWDLQLIRERLATMGLDWSTSFVSPHDRVAGDEPPRIRVEPR